MSVKENAAKILAELSTNVQYLNESSLQLLVAAIREANHIFLAGAGRSGIAIKAFANRLMHLGYSVSVVGEITSPHSRDGDLVIIGSGSGATESLAALAKKAKMKGVLVALVTMARKSVIAEMSDITIILPGVSPKLKNEGVKIASIQPMGSAFEQLCFVTYDGIILELMEQTGQTSEQMFLRHADFE